MSARPDSTALTSSTHQRSRSRSRMAMLLVIGVAVLGVVAPVVTSPRTAPAHATVISPPNTPLPAGTYCNQTPTQPTADGQPVSPTDYNGPTKVMHIFEENESAGVVDADGDSAAFELNTLGGQCGVLTNMHGETHPSEPNYLNDTDGGNNPQWTLCDFPPNSPVTTCPYGMASQITAPNIFSQLESKSGTNAWRVYGQDQSTNCQMNDSGLFAVRHNPSQYYTGINCAANDVPAGNWQSQQGRFYSDITSGNLPAFTMYTPNNSDDGHDPTSNNPPSVNLSNIDMSLSKLMTLIQSGPDYQSGKLVVMVTFDEGTTTGQPPYTDASTGEDCTDRAQGNTKPSCQILTYVAGRYVPWQSDNDFTNHYSMLKTTQQVLGLTPANGYAWLAHAGDMLTNDFYYQFKLAPDSWSTGPTIPPNPPSIPSAPTALTATVGNAAATVGFSAPASSGGAAISSYTVTSSPGGVVTTGTRSPLTVTGLTNGVSYTFTVTATNSFGAGPPSAASNAVVPIGPGNQPNLLPDGGFEAGNSGWTAFTSGTLTRVTSPVHGGAEALQVSTTNTTSGLVGLTQTSVVTNSTKAQTYTASCYVRPTSANLNVTLRFLEYTQNYSSNVQLQQTAIASLPLNAWTFVQVAAVALNAGERIIPQIYSTSERASTGALVYDDCSVSAGTSSITVPTAPTGVIATPGNGSATVNFTASASNGGAVITSYTVTSSPGGKTATGTTSPLTVTGLTNGTTYTFTATATNSAGTGPASTPSPAVTPKAAVAVPGAPTGVSATAGDASAVVSFATPVSDGGAPITSYTVTSSPGGKTATGTTSPLTITGLTNGTTYTFTVTATNSAGTGPASTPSPTVTPTGGTPIGLPGMPINVVATPANGSASVAFGPPASDGGSPVTSYTVTASPGNITGVGTSSPIRVSGLTNGTAYTFTVTATNAAGSGPTSTATPAVTPYAELLTDPGFESGNGAWTAFSIGTLTRVTAPVHGGASALKVSSPNATANLVGLTNNLVVPNSVMGATYTASCWVQPTGANLNIIARFLEYTQSYSSNTHLQQTTITALPVGVWTKIQVTSVALKSGERIIPQIYSTNETSNNGSIIYDDCSVFSS